MEYQVIPDFLYLNEPIYRRVDGVPQARLVSSVLSVNAEPASQHGIYPWTPDSAGPSSGFRRQGGYKRSSTTTTTTSRNKKLIRRTRRQNRSRKQA